MDVVVKYFDFKDRLLYMIVFVIFGFSNIRVKERLICKFFNLFFGEIFEFVCFEVEVFGGFRFFVEKVIYCFVWLVM